MNGYVPNYIDEIKRRLSIVDIIAPKISLKKTGRNYKGLCPFHSEKSGSFFVFPETESYYCFGCHEAGDAFTFLMKTEGYSFGEVLEELAGRTGVALPEKTRKEEESGESQSRKQEKERLLEINSAAATYFSHLLLHSKEGQAARDYLQKRGVSAQSVELFGLGYALDSWEALFNHLTGKGRFTPQELVTAGLVGERENGGGHYDRFRGRLVFPIRNRNGEIIAFGGRVLEGAPKDAPKYLNSPQTPLFDKSATLFGLDLAKDAVRRHDRAVIVEGYMDVIVAHQHGFNNVVAPLGTALNEKHVGVLKKLTKRIVLALDADTAGEMATLRGIEVAKSAFDTKVVPVPTARGLVRFEQQVDADIKVATLPPGKDPDEVVREGPGRWRELIERALPTVDYYFAAVKASVDLNSARGKSEAVERLAPAIVEIRDRIEREHYIQQLARLTQTDANVIRNEVNKAARAETQRPRPVPRPEELPAVEPGAEAETGPKPITIGSWRELELEDFLLAFLLRYPDGFGVPGADGHGVNAEDFTRSENRLIFETLLEIERAGGQFTDIEEKLAPELLTHLATLQVYIQSEPELTDLFSVQEAMRFQLNRLREQNLRRLYEQGSRAMEEEVLGDTAGDNQAGEEDAEAQAELWHLINGVASRLKVYYPKPSPIFRDSRTR